MRPLAWIWAELHPCAVQLNEAKADQPPAIGRRSRLRATASRASTDIDRRKLLDEIEHQATSDRATAVWKNARIGGSPLRTLEFLHG